MKGFEEAHAAFIQSHLERRSGERRGRLERGHGHAELMFARNVWWPLKGHFQDLHPEYQIFDWRGGTYFADYLYAPKHYKVVIEIKGYTEHVANMDRQKYCYELNRETFFAGMGFQVISFAYDDVASRPDLCIFLLRTVLSRYESNQTKKERVNLVNKEIFRYAAFLARPIRPIDIVKYLSIDHRTAVNHLQQLSKVGWLKPLPRGTGQRILYYEVTKQGLDSGIW